VGGSRLTISPQLIQDCRQIILQVVAAQQPGVTGVTNAARFRTVGSSMPGLRAVGSNVARLASVGPRRAVGSGVAGLRTTTRLPRTGGMDPASLLTLGAGGLLIAGGLLARRMAQR
jgi:LPXTG-motif cell wall-anchored protein